MLGLDFDRSRTLDKCGKNFRILMHPENPGRTFLFSWCRITFVNSARELLFVSNVINMLRMVLHDFVGSGCTSFNQPIKFSFVMFQCFNHMFNGAFS